jgi:hypothetical protein
MEDINLDGLSERQRALVARFVEFVREADAEHARREFSRAWAEWSKRVPDLPENEVEALVEEAIAYARGRG